MQYIVETNKTITQAVNNLESIVRKYNFGVLHIHNLKQTMNNKGIDFENECLIVEICNPKKAKFVLTNNMNLNMALPCRISVYEDNGKTKIGTILPTSLLGALSSDESLQEVAREVEEISKTIIDEAR